MTKWAPVLVFALAACSGHSVTTPSLPARAELHVAPRFAPIAATKLDAVAAATSFLRGNAQMLGYDAAHADFAVLNHEVTADGLDHVRLQQTFDGVKVWGSDVIVHYDGQNITGMDGHLLGALANLDLAPSVADTTAMTMAKSDYVARHGGAAPRTAAESTELVVLPLADGSAHLAWHLVFNALGQAGGLLGIMNYFVDAHDGSVLRQYNNLQTANVEASGPGGNTRVTRTWNMDLDAVQSGSTYQFNTTQFVTTNQKTNQIFSGTSLNPLTTDLAANDAHGFAEITIKMLKDWQGYNSIDNKGLQIASFVHVPDPTTGQYNYDNAFWDGKQMNYGDGDGTQFFEFTGALDVIAHEMDHGFTQYHANLDYQDPESGGMNESFSDIAGTTAKFYYDPTHADFNLGSDIFVKAGQYIRWMCTPSMDGMSLDSATQYNPSNPPDVHYTSGVMNKAFCRAAKRLSGADPDTGTATVDGVKKASKAWYEANASHWTSSAQWTDGCQGVVDAATALTYSASDISALGDSWKDVGVTCNYTHVNGFGMTMTPTTQTATAGTSATFMIATTVGAGNTAQSVALSATSLPSGVTATFNPASVMSGASSTLTIQTAYDTPVGDIAFKVTGMGTAAAQTVAGTLTVTAPPPDMTPPPIDMAMGNGNGNGGTGGSGGGTGDHGGSSGCSFGGDAAPSAGALLFALAGIALALRRRVALARRRSR